jgi:hypothetical protein
LFEKNQWVRLTPNNVESQVWCHEFMTSPMCPVGAPLSSSYQYQRGIGKVEGEELRTLVQKTIARNTEHK